MLPQFNLFTGEAEPVGGLPPKETTLIDQMKPLQEKENLKIEIFKRIRGVLQESYLTLQGAGTTDTYHEKDQVAIQIFSRIEEFLK